MNSLGCTTIAVSVRRTRRKRNTGKTKGSIKKDKKGIITVYTKHSSDIQNSNRCIYKKTEHGTY